MQPLTGASAEAITILGAHAAAAELRSDRSRLATAMMLRARRATWLSRSRRPAAHVLQVLD